MPLNPSAAVQSALTLSTSLVRQFDGLVQEEIAARYAYEMARSRPQQNQQVAQDTAQYEGRLKSKQWEIEQMLKLSERLTGHDIHTLREFGDQLSTLVERIMEIAQEIRQRELLSPALKAALDGSSEADALEAIAKIDGAAADLPMLEKHHALLSAKADELAAHVKYNEVSNIVSVGLIR